MLTADRDTRGLPRGGWASKTRPRFCSRAGPASRSFPEICRHDRRDLRGLLLLGGDLGGLNLGDSADGGVGGDGIFLCDGRVR